MYTRSPPAHIAMAVNKVASYRYTVTEHFGNTILVRTYKLFMYSEHGVIRPLCPALDANNKVAFETSNMVTEWHGRAVYDHDNQLSITFSVCGAKGPHESLQFRLIDDILTATCDNATIRLQRVSNVYMSARVTTMSKTKMYKVGIDDVFGEFMGTSMTLMFQATSGDTFEQIKQATLRELDDKLNEHIISDDLHVDLMFEDHVSW